MSPMRGNVSLDLCNLIKKYCEDGESSIDTKIFDESSNFNKDDLVDNIATFDTVESSESSDIVKDDNPELSTDSASFIDKLIGNNSELSLEEQLRRNKSKKKSDNLDDKDVLDLLSNSSDLINSIKQSEMNTGDNNEGSAIATEVDTEETNAGISKEDNNEISKEGNNEADTKVYTEDTVKAGTEVPKKNVEEDNCEDEDESEEYNIAYEFSKCTKPSDTLDVIKLLKEYGYEINVNNEIGACAISELIYTLERLANSNGIELGYSEYISHNVSSFKKNTADAIMAMYDKFSKNGDDDYNTVLMELSLEVD